MTGSNSLVLKLSQGIGATYINGSFRVYTILWMVGIRRHPESTENRKEAGTCMWYGKTIAQYVCCSHP
jgi:hypothetical protein